MAISRRRAVDRASRRLATFARNEDDDQHCALEDQERCSDVAHDIVSLSQSGRKPVQIRWRDADDRARAVIERDRLADDRTIPAEVTAPEVVREHNDGIVSGMERGGFEETARERLRAEDIEVAVRHVQAADALGAALVGQHRRAPLIDRQVLE
jgi:hypothetical protein